MLIDISNDEANLILVACGLIKDWSEKDKIKLNNVDKYDELRQKILDYDFGKLKAKSEKHELEFPEFCLNDHLIRIKEDGLNLMRENKREVIINLLYIEELHIETVQRSLGDKSEEAMVIILHGNTFYYKYNKEIYDYIVAFMKG